MASYIGGTANYFETASIVNQSASSPLILSIAAVDISVMCVYFSFLLFLHRLAQRRQTDRRRMPPGKGKTASVRPSVRGREAVRPSVRGREATAPSSGMQALAVSSLALGITRAALMLQQRVGLQGLSTALCTLLAVTFTRALPAAWRAWLEQAAIAPTIYFTAMFYACVGMSIHWQDLLSVGAPAFRSVAGILAAHLTAVALSWSVVRHALRQRRGGEVDFDYAIIASNAAVGGPATAAMMAAQLGRPDLVLPATLCGILGYLVGTPVGVRLASTL